eukprot:COSAG06_NODE_61886_length_266_cov_0.934132_1_plen_53_part_01
MTTPMVLLLLPPTLLEAVALLAVVAVARVSTAQRRSQSPARVAVGLRGERYCL